MESQLVGTAGSPVRVAVQHPQPVDVSAAPLPEVPGRALQETPPPDSALGCLGGDDGEGPEVATADGDPVPAPCSPVVDDRLLLLIRRYSAPDRRGWVMDPADLHYRLTRWHGARITREQLLQALPMIRGRD